MYVYVDSLLAEHSNSYSVILPHPIRNITQVDLVSAQLPKTSPSDSYVFLDIEQLRTVTGVQVAGVQSSLTKTTSNVTTIEYTPQTNYFAALMYTTGSTILYKEMDYKSSVILNNPIEKLDRLTIRWVDKFGTVVDWSPSGSHHSFVLRFHTADPSPVYVRSRVNQPRDFTLVIVFVVVVLAVALVFSGSRRRLAAAA